MAIIWQKCFREEVCVKIPFDGKKCVSAEGCVRIITESGSFFVEIQLFGQSVRYNLAKQCYPAYTVGIASLEVCADPVFESSNLKGVKLSGNLCIGTKIAGINIKKCWKVIQTEIRFFTATQIRDTSTTDDREEIVTNDFKSELVRTGAEYVYIEYDLIAESNTIGVDIRHGEE